MAQLDLTNLVGLDTPTPELVRDVQPEVGVRSPATVDSSAIINQAIDAARQTNQGVTQTLQQTEELAQSATSATRRGVEAIAQAGMNIGQIQASQAQARGGFAETFGQLGNTVAQLLQGRQVEDQAGRYALGQMRQFQYINSIGEFEGAGLAEDFATGRGAAAHQRMKQLVSEAGVSPELATRLITGYQNAITDAYANEARTHETRARTQAEENVATITAQTNFEIGNLIRFARDPRDPRTIETLNKITDRLNNELMPHFGNSDNAISAYNGLMKATADAIVEGGNASREQLQWVGQASYMSDLFSRAAAQAGPNGFTAVAAFELALQDQALGDPNAVGNPFVEGLAQEAMRVLRNPQQARLDQFNNIQEAQNMNTTRALNERWQRNPDLVRGNLLGTMYGFMDSYADMGPAQVHSDLANLEVVKAIPDPQTRERELRRATSIVTLLKDIEDIRTGGAEEVVTSNRRLRTMELDLAKLSQRSGDVQMYNELLNQYRSQMGSDTTFDNEAAAQKWNSLPPDAKVQIWEELLDNNMLPTNAILPSTIVGDAESIDDVAVVVMQAAHIELERDIVNGARGARTAELEEKIRSLQDLGGDVYWGSTLPPGPYNNVLGIDLNASNTRYRAFLDEVAARNEQDAKLLQRRRHLDRYGAPGNSSFDPGISTEGLEAGTPQYRAASELQAWKSAASRLGLTPVELAAIASLESSIGANQIGAWGDHKGIFQFNADNQKRYGVYAGQPVEEQLDALVQYMFDRGYKPEMGQRAAYATILAGTPTYLNSQDVNGTSANLAPIGPGSANWDNAQVYLEGLGEMIGPRAITNPSQDRRIDISPPEAVQLEDNSYYHDGAIVHQDGTVDTNLTSTRPLEWDLADSSRTPSNSRTHGYAMLENNPNLANAVEEAATSLNVPSQWVADWLAFSDFGAEGRSVGSVFFELKSVNVFDQLDEIVERLKPYSENFEDFTAFTLHYLNGNDKLWDFYNRTPAQAMNTYHNFEGDDGKTYHIRLQDIFLRVGNTAGRMYDTPSNQVFKDSQPVHEHPVTGCRMCEDIQKNGTFVPHRGQVLN